MDNQYFLNRFKTNLFDRGKDKKTVGLYFKDVEQFIECIQKDVRLIDTSDINKFKLSLANNGRKENTIHRKLISVKHFISFLNEYYNLNIKVYIVYPKLKQNWNGREEKDFLNVDDFHSLMKVSDERARTLFSVMYYTGMRVSEVLQMKLSEAHEGVISIRGKGGHERFVYLNHPKVKEAIYDYLKVRSGRESDYLFIGQRGRINRHTVNTLIKKYGNKAGLPIEKCHAHNLRHLFCLTALDKGIPLEDVAAIVGHSSIEFTRRYIEKTKSEYSDMLMKI